MYVHRSLEVWGSPEALAREKKLRKEAEIEYRESKYIQFKAELTEKQLVNETCAIITVSSLVVAYLLCLALLVLANASFHFGV